MNDKLGVKLIKSLPEENFIGKENVAKVLALINEKKINAEIYYHPNTAVKNLDLHLSIYGGTPAEVLKCLCLVAKQGPLVVIASGEVKIDMKKLSQVSGYTQLSMAKKEELSRYFNRGLGEVDPLTIPSSIPIQIELKLLEKEWVVGSCGSPHVGLKISPKEIVQNVNGTIVDLAK